MYKTVRTAVVFLVMLLVFAKIPTAYAATSISQTYGQSIRGTTNGFPFLLLRGNAYERGKAYGALAGPEIISSVNTMVTYIRSAGLDWNSLKNNLSRFSYTQRYLDELNGMMAGIEESLSSTNRIIPALGTAITRNDLQTFQTPDLFQTMHCSQFSAWGSRTTDGEVIIGRNMDYPAIFNTSNAVVLAVDPSEPELMSTMDAVYFGYMVSGIMAINEQGVYLAGNAGNSGDVFPPQPYAGMPTLREAIEQARPATAVEDVTAVIRNKIAISSIYHVVVPVTVSSGRTPIVIEYAPTSSGSNINTRGPAGLVDGLIATNHFGTSGSGGSQTRYQTLNTSLANYKNSGTMIGFEQARSMMASVAQTGTYLTRYSGIIWPKQRRMMIAKSNGSQPATNGNYTDILWDDIFNLNTTGPKIGDADGDGDVDGVDFTRWLNRYDTTTSAGAADGDFNNDSKVDGVDYTLWLKNYGL